MTDHVWGEWETTVEPTETTPGERVHICAICNAKDIDEIPALSSDDDGNDDDNKDDDDKSGSDNSGSDNAPDVSDPENTQPDDPSDGTNGDCSEGAANG